MWQYNSFYDNPNNVLMHSSHKYINRYEKNGKYVYIYDKPATKKNHAQIQEEVRRDKMSRLGYNKEYNDKKRGVDNSSYMDVVINRLQKREQGSGKFEKKYSLDSEDKIDAKSIEFRDSVSKYVSDFENEKNKEKKKQIALSFIDYIGESWDSEAWNTKQGMAKLAKQDPKAYDLLKKAIKIYEIYSEMYSGNKGFVNKDDRDEDFDKYEIYKERKNKKASLYNK